MSSAFFLLIPKPATTLNQDTTPPLSSRPDPDSCYAAQDTAACAAFIKESRMELINAMELDRNPGERSAVESLP
jgi:hypothetical protein